MEPSIGVTVYIDMFSGSTPCLVSFELLEKLDNEEIRQEVIRAASFADQDEIHDYIIAATWERDTTRFWNDYRAQKLQLPSCSPEKRDLIDDIFADIVIAENIADRVAFVSQSKRIWEMLNDKHMLNMFACALWTKTPKKYIHPVSGGRRHLCVSVK